jgi:subtilisin family serine protease
MKIRFIIMGALSLLHVNAIKADILVYFVDGIQCNKTINGNEIQFTSESLKTLMDSLSISTDSVKPLANIIQKKAYISGEKITQQPDISNGFYISITAKQCKYKQKILDRLNQDHNILYAEETGSIVPCVVPNDPYYNRQWGMTNASGIFAENAWDKYKGNPNNIIAIIDGGVSDHVDFGNKVINCGIGTWGEHGTHVAGIAAAQSNNGIGVSGIDWNARILSKRVDSTYDSGFQSVIDAVDYDSNVVVLNNSYSLTNEDGSPGRYSITLRRAVAYAYKKNRVFVAAAGNHQLSHPNVVSYPAGYPNVLVVASCNNQHVIATSSSCGEHVDICAPGVGIYSTISTNSYTYKSGTSMAAPHVSGVASLLKGYNRNLSNDDIENIIKLSALKCDSMNGTTWTPAYGYGCLNADSALTFLSDPYSLEQLSTHGGNVINTSDTYHAKFIDAPNIQNGNYLVKRIEVQKEIPISNNIWNIVGIWGRGVFTTGWRNENPNYGEGYCEVINNSETEITLRTYVYQVWSLAGQYLGYYPTTPDNVTFAYTILGMKTPQIQGPSLFCDTAVYSLENVPSGATVQWIVTPTTRVKKAATIVRGQGTSQVTLKRGFTLGGIKADTLVRDTSIRVASLAAVNLRRPYSGNGSITAIVTFGGESYSVSADFTIPSQTATEKPVVNGANNSLWYVNVSHTLSVRNCDSVPNDKLLWEVHLPGQSTPLTQTGRSVTFTPKSTGTVTVIIANMESCSASNVDTLTYRVIDRPSIRFVNPATAASSLDVVVSSVGDEQITTIIPYDGDYTLELWSELLGCVCRVEANEPTTQISLSGLPTGIYFIKLIINDELVTTKQLIVR